MDSSASRALFLFLTMLVVLMTSSVDVQGQRRVEPVGEVRRGSATDRRHRPSPQRKTPEDAIRRQIERVKQKILSQLGYSVRTAPHASPRATRTSLPQPLVHLHDVDVTRQGGGPTSGIDVATANTSSSSRGTRRDRQRQSKYKQATLIVLGHRRRRERGWSYRFNVQNLAAGVRLTSAYLWLHKTRDVSTTSGGSSLTLTVQSVYADDDDDDDVSKSRTRRYQLSWTSGWVQVDISELVRRLRTRLTVNCFGSSCRALTRSARSSRRRPFVMVGTRMSRQSERRNRRHLRPPCVDDECCRLHPYYVSFSELNWTFIQQPVGFNVNFCYGSCTS